MNERERQEGHIRWQQRYVFGVAKDGPIRRIIFRSRTACALSAFVSGWAHYPVSIIVHPNDGRFTYARHWFIDEYVNARDDDNWIIRRLWR